MKNKLIKDRVIIPVILLALVYGMLYIKYLYVFIIGKEAYIALDLWTRDTSIFLARLAITIGAVMLITRKRLPGALDTLGMKKGFIKGLLYSVLFTAPMFIGYAILFPLRIDLNAYDVITGSVFPGVFEEVIFRAFLIGLLMRVARWGFIPAVILSSLIFASLHLYQAQHFTDGLMVFTWATLGGAAFAWLFVEWSFNLWIPIFTHLFMDLSFELFDVGHTINLTPVANVLRVITIVLFIVITVKRTKKNGSNLKGRLWVWTENTQRV